jgi:diguanylate cyclase (GGDEF)-like protein
VFLRDPKSQTLKCVFAVGLDVPRLLNRTLSGEYSQDGWVASTRGPVVNSDPRITFESAGLDGRTELKSALVCPLVFNDTLIGVLAVYHIDADRYTEGHRRLLERVAEQAGVVLHNSLVFEKTQEEALTDALTGLSNRRSIVLHLSQELSRAERLRSRVALILLDIDDFKSINDNYGHQQGDVVLRHVARIVRENSRDADSPARYGGEEMALILPHTDLEGSAAIAERVRSAIAALRISRLDGQGTLRITASVGVAASSEGFKDGLIAEADGALYEAKRGGKNRTVQASPRTANVSGPE